MSKHHIQPTKPQAGELIPWTSASDLTSKSGRITKGEIDVGEAGTHTRRTAGPDVAQPAVRKQQEPPCGEALTVRFPDTTVSATST